MGRVVQDSPQTHSTNTSVIKSCGEVSNYKHGDDAQSQVNYSFGSLSYDRSMVKKVVPQQTEVAQGVRGELSYLAPLGSENISAPYFKQCFFQGGEVLPPRQSNTTPPSSKTEITNILFYTLNFASIIKFKM